ncbi:radical SAM protein [Methanobrevibacter sp. 87.7]|uniref:radical SAM protein n=1 Tax=Methanobrevibacter sp. 87.7 TaxID=387957 RepID=UPI000B4FDCF6|nr:radical SAM protein [Methanobrevibacter sp. 87.7]OWT32520.1 radical SAM protein [Methanobrevibacter sp. 87.7]
MLYEENIVQKKLKNIKIRFGLIYPNIYKVAMSSLGYQILYNLINEINDTWCERIIYPKTRSIESNSPAKDFNILSFTIQFEEDYFNLVKMLAASDIPLYSKNRTSKDPLIIAGGPCVTANPMPLSPFIDMFIIGEGEMVLNDLIDIYRNLDNPREQLEEFLELDGIYIPKFNNKTDIVLVENMDKAYHIKYPIVIHTDNEDYKPVFGNGILLNVSRGCSRGCRFCMSGYLYRPKRESSLEKLIEISEIARKNSNLNRVTLIAPSVSDYSNINELTEELYKRGFEISTPSMRIETITEESLKSLKKSGQKTLTIAPESIYKLRRSINKDISDEKIEKICDLAIKIGFNLKLYFIIGFPNETNEDLKELAKYIKKIDSKKRKGISIKFSINPLIPKAQTPLQWEEYNIKSIKSKIRYLKRQLKGINVKFDSAKIGLKQYVLSCGDENISELLEYSIQNKINTNTWKKYIPHYNINDELPWSNIDLGYNDNFLKEEREKMKNNEIIPWCDENKCYNCKYNCL